VSFDTVKGFVSGSMLILVLIFFTCVLVGLAALAVMLFTDYQPQDIRRWIAKRAYTRKRAKAAKAGEELPPEPDPDLVVVPAITAVPGAKLPTYGRRTCSHRSCYEDLSTYWPHDRCLDHLVNEQAPRIAHQGMITNR